MARKSKHMALTEAIRQGQAKIAEGLKTGQMRSDNPSSQASSNAREQVLDAVVNGRTGILTSKEKSTKERLFSSRTKWILLSAFPVLVLGIWLTASLVKSSPEATLDELVQKSPINAVAVPNKTTPMEEQRRPDSLSEPVIKAPVTPKGDNVIWITRIEIDRRNELAPLKDFFGRKGIPTEIIDAGAWAGLVTQEGFDKDPAASGTEGYELLQRIKQIGPVYVEETNDTKFGLKPFQDAYGYKR